MSLRRRSVLLRVALLVLVPLLFLIGLFSYTVVTSASSALTLNRSKVMMDELGPPVASLQQALTRERAEMVVYGARPTPVAQAALEAQEAVTDRAVASVTATTDSQSVRQSASAGGEKAIAALRSGLAGLPALRAGIAAQAVAGQQAFTAYGDMIAASYGVLEQAIIQEGNSTQVLPGIAVIELAISNEYLQQESALLNGDFAVRAFPASAHQAFARLVGAHRLLYAQSYSYLDPADRASLDHDVNPHAAATITALEDRLVGSNVPGRLPPVSPAAWNAAVATVSAQTQQAVRQAEARLSAGARAQASSKLRDLYLAAGLGLAAVILSVVLSVWIAVNLARRLHRLRDSALDMANVRLPDVVRRLRGGEDVDVAAQLPMLDPGPDEIGQVKAAFNTAQRVAMEAAVDEARVRRGINDVFRNLARRSQALLERQMSLLDALERQADDPEHLESLFRIDHLTTRMRRHAESLIVLAGDLPKRSFPNPVPFVDVLRAAAAEVEEYRRVTVTCQAPAALAGPAVADVIHMLAEFVENATIFSPPNTQVRVTGDLVANGFAAEIEDRGLGMSDDDLARANASLARPPLFDLSGSDRFGMFVAAQLARRHGIRVTLRHSAYGGATAIVLIPRDLVVPVNALGQGANGHAATPARPVVPAPAPPDTAEQPVLARPPDVAEPGPPERFERFEPLEPLEPLDQLEPSADAVAREPASPPPVPAANAAPGNGVPENGVPANAVPANAMPENGVPENGGPENGMPGNAVTENGLPQRVRQANLAPQLRNRPAQAPPAGASGGHRSPEKARSVMSAFRRGWQRGVGDAHQEQDRGANLPQHGESR
jgi:signal transduction histidine kinase